MTAEQARRAAKILRDFATSLPCGLLQAEFKAECCKLAQALEDFALEEYAEEITDREALDAGIDRYPRLSC